MGILIDDLPATVSATREHVLPSMKGNQTQKLSVGQILDLLIQDAPENLDTLEKIAASLGGDPGLAATLSAAIALKADSTAVALKQDKADMVFGQCKLALSGGNLVLSRVNGRQLTINGSHQVIPVAGVSLAAAGLTPSTLYYIYAYMNTGTMTLEASTTGHSTDSTTGVEIRTGDATRTLVGMARPVAGPAWVNSNAQRFVRSWYNDQGVSVFNTFTASRSTTSTTYVELNAEIRCEAVIWSGENIDVLASGSAVNNAEIGGNMSSIGFDGTTTEVSGVT